MVTACSPEGEHAPSPSEPDAITLAPGTLSVKEFPAMGGLWVLRFSATKAWSAVPADPVHAEWYRIEPAGRSVPGFRRRDLLVVRTASETDAGIDGPKITSGTRTQTQGPETVGQAGKNNRSQLVQTQARPEGNESAGLRRRRVSGCRMSHDGESGLAHQHSP